MGVISYSEIALFVENNISQFHDKQLEDLKKLQLADVLRRKTPYLFKAKNLNIAGDLTKYILDAFLVSREETNFGAFLEQLAIFINKQVYGGWKSTNIGIDLEFEKEGIYYLVSIKSGPNWGNSDQINRMITNFDSLIRSFIANDPTIRIVPVNGCCYGRDKKPEKVAKLRVEGSEVKRELLYLKLCGQRFWTFISGIESLYIDIVEPLGHRAKEKNEAFQEEYAKVTNSFTKEFLEKFCHSDGAINWGKMVEISSA